MGEQANSFSQPDLSQEQGVCLGIVWGSVPETGMTQGLRGSWFPWERCYSRDFGKGKRCQFSDWVRLAEPRVLPVLYHTHSCLGDAAKAEPGSCWRKG